MALLDDDDGVFLVKEKCIRHKYTVIPNDQQELLSRPDAWNTKGIPNLPPKVLQDVKDAFIRRSRSAAASKRATPKGLDAGRANGPSRQKHRHNGHVAEADSTDRLDTVLSGDDDDDDDNDEGEPIPWTPSPSHHKQAPVRREELATLRPRTSHAESSSPVRAENRHPAPPSPAQPHHLAVPSSPPLPARQASTAVSQRPIRNARGPKATRPAPVVSSRARLAQPAPPSSLASEPDLEYQPPRAITDVMSPVDRALRQTRSHAPVHRVLQTIQQPAPTPPSAQESATVPCTWKEPRISVACQGTVQEPAPKRRRLVESPSLESSKAADPNGTAPPSSGRGARVSLNDSHASESSPAPSVISGTPAKRHPDPRLGRGPGQILSAGFPRLEHLPQVIEPAEEGYGSSQPSQPAQVGSFNSSGRLPPNGPASQAPFVAFKVAYPTYEGTIRDFISAAISIIQLQESRSLPEFLYDDYIRAWAHHYINYVEDCIQADRKPLRAIQWYNEYVSSPVFTKRIFTKGNITDITGHHRAEAEAYRREIRRLHNNPPSSPRAVSPATRSTPQSAREDLRLDSSAANNDVLSLPGDASPPATTSNTPLPGHEALSRNDQAPAKAASPAPTPDLDAHAALHPAQIESIEPLRSVPEYVSTLSQSGSSPSTMANARHCPPPSDLAKVNSEEERHPLAHVPAISTDTDPKGTLAATPASRSTNRGPSPTSSGQNKSSAFLGHVRTPNAFVKHTDSTSDEVPVDLGANKDDITQNIARPKPARGLPSSSNPTEALAKEPSPPRPKSPLPSFGDVLTQPPATGASFVPDFAGSIIPETAVKSRDVHRATQQSARRRISLPFNSENMPPPSSAAPASSKVRRKMLSEADRFKLFVERRLSQGSAPRSSMQG